MWSSNIPTECTEVPQIGRKNPYNIFNYSNKDASISGVNTYPGFGLNKKAQSPGKAETTFSEEKMKPAF